MFSNSLLSVINRPTRVTTTSATLIDNIFISSWQKEQISGILYTDISDHFPIFVIDVKKTISKEEQFVITRIYAQNNIKSFQDKLREIDIFQFLTAANLKRLLPCSIVFIKVFMIHVSHSGELN